MESSCNENTELYLKPQAYEEKILQQHKQKKKNNSNSSSPHSQTSNSPDIPEHAFAQENGDLSRIVAPPPLQNFAETFQKYAQPEKITNQVIQALDHKQAVLEKNQQHHNQLQDKIIEIYNK